MPPKASTTLKFRGLAYKCELEASVYLRNITRKVSNHKHDSVAYSFSIFDLLKLLTLAGTVILRSCNFKSV